MLKLRRMAGIGDVPSFYEYIKESSKVVKGAPVELTESQWAAIDNDEKGLFNNEKHYLVYEMGMLKIVPIKTSFIGNITNSPAEEKVAPYEDKTDATSAEGGDSEKTADDMKKAVKSGKKKTDTDEVVKESEEGDDEEDGATEEEKQEDAIQNKAECGQCHKEFPVSGEQPNFAKCEDHKDLNAIKESAEEKAKKLIKSARSGKRLTDTSETDTDANVSVDKPKSELGSEKFKEVDQADGHADKPKKIAVPNSKGEPADLASQGGNPVTENANSESDANKELAISAKKNKKAKDDKDDNSYFSYNEKKTKKQNVEESAQEIADRIIASVKAGNHPHDAKNTPDASEKKSLGFDYNKLVVDGTVVDNARPDDSKELENDAESTIEQAKEDKVEIPSKVISQIDTRVKELKAAQADFDEKGYNDGSVKQNAIDFLEKVKAHLGKGDMAGFQQSQILFQTLMSPIQHMLPSALVNFLATGRNSMKTTGEIAEVK